MTNDEKEIENGTTRALSLSSNRAGFSKKLTIRQLSKSEALLRLFNYLYCNYWSRGVFLDLQITGGILL